MKSARIPQVLVLLALGIIVVASCAKGIVNGDGDADGDTDADADTGGDGDADGDADAGGDADADQDEAPDGDLQVGCGDGTCGEDEDAATCPEDCPAECGDGVCTGDEAATTCAGDCPAFCGDEACTHTETASLCPGDCPAECGDGACTHDEEAASCPLDCPAVCGDELCSHSETALTCPDDCPSVCGDGSCTHEESAESCALDCDSLCGDDECTHDETATSCPGDCPARCPDGACTHDEDADLCPLDCRAVCPDGDCTHDESAVSCPADCDAVCPDSACTHDEDAASCPLDCDPFCSDGACTHEEDASSCAADCPAVCPDGACTHAEDASSCAADCPAYCPDGWCTHAEDVLSCPADCPALCPDGLCTHGETWTSCPEDCAAVGLEWETGGFIDLSLDAGATVVASTGFTSTDDGYADVALGFDFPFYGTTHATARVSTNGYLTFGTSGATFSNTTIPAATDPNDVIAVFWDDLYMGDRTNDERDSRLIHATRGTAPNRFAIIQWQDFRFLGGDCFLTFEVVLHEDGTVQMLYHEMTGISATGSRESGDSATVGIEDAAGGSGVQHGANLAGMVRPGTVLTYRPDGASYALGSSDNLVGEFLDIRPTGTHVAALAADDALSAAIDIGFTFRFYGVDYTQVMASTNGWIGLGAGHTSSDLGNSSLPSTTEPRPMVACLWDDGYGTLADSTAEHQTLGTEGNRVFVVQYTNWHFCCGATYTATYQVRLHEATGVADCVYGNLSGGTRALGDSATVGVQNAAGTLGVQRVLNEATLEPGDRIAFYPRDSGRTDYLGYGPHDGFTDISATGTLSTATGDDATQVGVALGFTFDYYGRAVTDVTIATNGQINLDGSSDRFNAELPSAFSARGLIGPFWDDLYVAGTSDAIYYQTLGVVGSRVFIVQWHRVSFYTAAYREAELTFQTRLNEADGSIDFVYGSLLANGADLAARRQVSGGASSVALQSYDRDLGQTCSSDDPGALLSGSWYSFSPR